MTPTKEITKRPLKLIKHEKNELKKSPEAYFKIGGISVFSLNNRAKSSENIFNSNSIKRIYPNIITQKNITDRAKTAEKTLKSGNLKNGKVFICNVTSIGHKQDITDKQSSSIKLKSGIVPTIEQLYKAWVKSRATNSYKTSETKRLNASEIPAISINKAQLHEYNQK